MKKFLSFAVVAALTLAAYGSARAQGGGDKSKRPSPPAKVTQTISSGATITIDYSQPAIKGRTIGKDLEPMPGKVWRAGANEATIFETDKAVKVEGKSLPAGKYSFFVLDNGNDWTLIFNKNWKIWGTEYEKNKSADVLKVNVDKQQAASSPERLTYTISKSGDIALLWGPLNIGFNVK
ncbi:DUF2911 domain-containing protein [Compostibacter hankyongensis]|uniref:DUF2911 domain-containing protein n=1 Tax=Compostibacter hankyongensis TaxID=1007089 RepID=A0ABP8FII1_9BACT